MTLLSDEKLRTRLSEKGLNRISELGLTWEKAAEQYRKLYLSVT
jgi:glycosyltransferase involved in cell wall biosynthesis